MTTLIELLRSRAWEHRWHRKYREDAADEIEHLTLDLHTERATVAALRAEVAGLRESAALRVQFHAAELADVTAELANAKVSGIHSCHDGCTRSGCVAGRLTAERDALREDAERYRWLRSQDWFYGPLCVLRNPKRVLTRNSALGADCPSGDRLDVAIDEARKATP